MIGTVVWFDAALGYGFISQCDGPDMFVHHRGIEMSGYRTLEKGQQVEYEVVAGRNGPQAARVRPL